jgi:hypothetical protein
VAAIGQQKTPAAEQKASPRPDPDSGANLFGPAAMTDLENRDPSKHYVFVSKNKLALSEYRRMGYRPEVAREGGVGVAGEEHEAGKDIEAYDHVLMSVSAERRAQLEQHGFGAAGGQKLADQIDGRIIDRKNVHDHFRGSIPRKGGREYFRLANETGALEEESANG